MKITTSFAFAFLLCLYSFAQFPSQVTLLDVRSGSPKMVDGNLSSGEQIDLAFASNSSVACFPATQNEFFNGNQVFYAFKMPAYSVAKIRLQSKKDMSLYAYQVGTNNFTLPPQLSSCVACEESHIVFNSYNKPEEVQINSIKNEYNIVVAVCGYNNLKEGDFKLTIDMKTTVNPDENIKDNNPPLIIPVDLTPGNSATKIGNISGGKQIPLEWASYSSMACFPATQNENFRGRHVFYTLKMPAYSELFVTLKSGSNINIYGIQGYNGTSVPPEISTCVSCEASHTNSSGQTIRFNALKNPYNVLIGVAGKKDMMAGDFQIHFDLKDNTPIDMKINDDTPALVVPIDLTAGNSTTKIGNISGGKQIPLEWASYSSMACFPATQNENFRGKHVFYTLKMPAYSELFVTLKSGSNINIYGIQGYNGTSVPPEISTCVSCEASHTNSSGQTIRFNALKNPYNVLIGVAGKKDMMSGDFQIHFDMKDNTPLDQKIHDDSPALIIPVDLAAGNSTTKIGNISGGKQIPLEWASYSSMACFPATQNENFRGKHVFYTLKMPAYSELFVTLKSGSNINIYGIQGYDGVQVPPEITTCVSCEASHTNSSGQTIRFNALKNPYNVLIGVAGKKDIMSGDFQVHFDLKDNTPLDNKIHDDKPAKVYTINAEKGKALMWKGNVSEGKQVPLGWAENSSVACFPGTQFENFRGNHVFYTLELPRYSKMKIRVKSSKNINVYAIQGHDGKSLPPEIHSCVSCEAAYFERNGLKEVELTAINNPYKVLIGVAGAKDVMDGDYELVVELMDR